MGDAERSQYDARTLKVGTEFEPRPSVADEQLLTERVRTREAEELWAARRAMLGDLAAAERAIENARGRLGAVDRQTRRNLDRIRQAIARIREQYGEGPSH
jgi:hypothetical protein